MIYSSIVNHVPRPDRSRAALIDSAAMLFRRQGYAATGLNQILDEAGVKPGSLYHHFPQGKQQLAAAVVDGVGADIEQLLRRFLAGGLPVADIVDQWIDLMGAGLSADQRDGCPIEPIATESVNASPLVREASARAFTGWCRAVEERLHVEDWPGGRSGKHCRCGDLIDRGSADGIAHHRRRGRAQGRQTGGAPLAEPVVIRSAKTDTAR